MGDAEKTPRNRVINEWRECALDDCSQVWLTGRADKRYCCKAHSTKANRRANRARDLNRERLRQRRVKATETGRECRWCNRADDRTPFLQDRECCRCAALRYRHPCPRCGGPAKRDKRCACRPSACTDDAHLICVAGRDLPLGFDCRDA